MHGSEKRMRAACARAQVSVMCVVAVKHVLHTPYCSTAVALVSALDRFALKRKRVVMPRPRAVPPVVAVLRRCNSSHVAAQAGHAGHGHAGHAPTAACAGGRAGGRARA